MVEVIPGILEQDFTGIVDKIRKVEEYVPWVQIDLLDGTLFGNSSFHDPLSFSTLRTKANLELHMMVINPGQLIGEWKSVGFKRFIGHVEGITDIENFIVQARNVKAEVGLALDLDTEISVIDPYFPNIDVVLVMTIHTGKSGQLFEDKALMKIQKIRSQYPNLAIEVDGGINPQTGRKCIQAGATRLVSTSYIFSSVNTSEAIKQLQGF